MIQENICPFPYEWRLSEANFTKDKGKVFSTFACGGGSTMGYKLQGFDVIGCNEIDERMMKLYIENHKPKYPFLEKIQTFKNRTDLPEELFSLDILDGSPPCSTFSISGSREEDWGKERKFSEGKEVQVLDTLFFDYIDLVKRLQPKVAVAENVAGLLIGNAIKYVREIYAAFEEAGYECQHWLLNANEMGIPQNRSRVFFIALRNDLCNKFMNQVDMFTFKPKLILDFNLRKIPLKEIYRHQENPDRPLRKKTLEIWEKRKEGDADYSCTLSREGRPNSWFNYKYLYDDNVINTIIAQDANPLFNEPRFLNNSELCLGGSFPLDYNFLDKRTEYVVGMSVPPLMTAQISKAIYEQWLSKL